MIMELALRHSIVKGLFRRCDVSEPLKELERDTYALKFGATYQVCNVEGTTIIAGGNPTIWHGNYDGAVEDSCFRLKGKPEYAVTAKELFYAVYFPRGIVVGSVYPRSATIPENKLSKILLEMIRKECGEEFVKQFLGEQIEEVYPKGKVDGPAFLVLRKDVTENEKIHRKSPRPFQTSSGIYLEELFTLGE